MVIDAADFLRAPQALLQRWCERLGLAFSPAMLNWPAGPRDSDGVWAAHWYANVWNSTGFAPYQPRHGELGETHLAIVEACRPHYEALYRWRLRP